ncbi:MAG: DUF1674 domain-containing protein [Burkholderiales bacterium]
MAMISERPARSIERRRVAYGVHTMDEKSTDPPEPEPKLTLAPDLLPGTAPRERATPEGDGLDPTRYGDWEMNGRCIDF